MKETFWIFSWLLLPIAAAVCNMALKVVLEISSKAVYFIARKTADEWWLTLYLFEGAVCGGVPAWLLQSPQDPPYLKTAAALVGSLTGIVVMLDIMFSLTEAWMGLQRSIFILTSKGKVRSHA